jgi:hypothetical protein
VGSWAGRGRSIRTIGRDAPGRFGDAEGYQRGPLRHLLRKAAEEFIGQITGHQFRGWIDSGAEVGGFVQILVIEPRSDGEELAFDNMKVTEEAVGVELRTPEDGGDPPVVPVEGLGHAGDADGVGGAELGLDGDLVHGEEYAEAAEKSRGTQRRRGAEERRSRGEEAVARASMSAVVFGFRPTPCLRLLLAQSHLCVPLLVSATSAYCLCTIAV